MTDYVTPTTWEQCAAHVEAGGVVEIKDAPGVWINDRAAATIYRGRCGTPDDGWAPRRLVPIETEATGAERYLAGRLDDPEYAEAYRKERGAIDVPDGYDAVHLLDLAWGVIANADGWNDDTSWRQAAERWRDGYHRLLDGIHDTTPITAPSLVPPWPGAVLSGLCDEDGVPTWLAQAGQVRGEQVRGRRSGPWGRNVYGADVWVEVRAPRAVAEPATERVPWWEAVGREVTDQDGERVTIEHVQCGDGAGPSVTAYNAAERRDTSLLRVPIPVRGDGTVEVLVEAGR